MALTDKDIIITPNRGQSADPKISFSGANTSVGAQTINLQVYPSSNGTLSFEGSAGQLFSVTNNLSTGSIFSVNDISGIPSIDVDASGVVSLVPFSGKVAIGMTTTPNSILHISSKSSSSIFTDNYTASTSAAAIVSRHARGTAASPTATQSGDNLMQLLGRGYGATGWGSAASEIAFYAGAAFTDTAQSSGIIFKTVPTGTITPLERVRILPSGNVGIFTTSPLTPLHVSGDAYISGVRYHTQAAQASKSAAATLTAAELEAGLIQYTGADATLTLPTGTNIEAAMPVSAATDMAYDFFVINTGTGTATLGTATGLTLVGSMAVLTNSSGMFRVRKTAASTYTVYRLT